MSYQGSKIFEAIGIDKSVIDKYFTNTVSPVSYTHLVNKNREYSMIDIIRNAHCRRILGKPSDLCKEDEEILDVYKRQAFDSVLQVYA